MDSVKFLDAVGKRLNLKRLVLLVGNMAVLKFNCLIFMIYQTAEKITYKFKKSRDNLNWFEAGKSLNQNLMFSLSIENEAKISVSYIVIWHTMNDGKEDKIRSTNCLLPEYERWQYEIYYWRFKSWQNQRTEIYVELVMKRYNLQSTGIFDELEK